MLFFSLMGVSRNANRNFDSMERALRLHEIERSLNHLESESQIPPEDLLSESLKRSLPSMPGFLFTWKTNNG